MEKKLNIILEIITIIAILLACLIFIESKKEEKTFSGLGYQSSLRISTTTNIGPQLNTTIFSKSTEGCNSRIITTGSSAIMFTIGEPTNGNFASTTLDGDTGFWQNSSTTQSYSSDEFGCGQWTGYSYSSTTITTAEF